MKKNFLLSVLAVSAIPLFADVKMPAIFSDHAVLQKSSATVVFGKADVNEKVTVKYGNASATAVADKNGRFEVTLDLSKDDGKSKKLLIEGKNKVVINDVITGDVWLAAGQSNMQFRIEKSLNGKAVAKKSANDSLRTFKFRFNGKLDASQGECNGVWFVASPRKTGTFSAVAYYFGRKINAETNRNIGLVDPAWGSSSIESWMSNETLMKKSTPAIAKMAKEEIAKYETYDANLAEYIKKYEAWAKDCARAESSDTVVPPEKAKWSNRKTIFGSINGDGVVWFRKKITINKKDVAYGKVKVGIGCPNAPVDLFIDGKKAGAFSLSQAKSGAFFRLSVPATVLSVGEHEITLKVNARDDKFSFGRSFFFGNHQEERNWQICREKNYAKLTAEQSKAKPADIPKKELVQKVPTTIWNGMMTHIVPYTMTGVIWYQGEANSKVTHSIHYADHQKAFVEQLRREFRNPVLPYYTVQLTSYMSKSSDPADFGHWPELRRQQEITSRLVPNTSHVTIIDCGESRDIHPIDKQPVGERLANVALANVYGKKDVCWQSPVAVKAEKTGALVKVSFENTYGGLVAKPLDDFYWVNRTSKVKAKLVRNSPTAAVEGFAVCGKDGKWFWADKADIDGSSVIVSSSKVSDPVAVHYAWQNNPTCNLFSKGGLPVSSFKFELK